MNYKSHVINSNSVLNFRPPGGVNDKNWPKITHLFVQAIGPQTCQEGKMPQIHPK